MSWLIAISDGLINLVCVALGALIAWKSGTAIHLQQAQERKLAELQSKLEDFVVACYEITAWTQKQVDFFVFSEKSLSNVDVFLESEAHKIIPPELSKILCMRLLHFPNFDEQVEILGKAILSFTNTLCDIGIERVDYLEKHPTVKHYVPADYQARLDTPLQKIVKAQKSLLDAARDLKHELDNSKS